MYRMHPPLDGCAGYLLTTAQFAKGSREGSTSVEHEHYDQRRRYATLVTAHQECFFPLLSIRP